MECCIFLRKTIDWHKIKNMRQFSRICCFPEVLRKTKWWGDHFSIPYWSYRAGLKRIAEKSLKNTGLPILQEREISDDMIVIPLDDDDWLRPDIWDFVKPSFSDPKVEMVFWDGVLLQTEQGRVDMGAMSTKEYVESCCYAVRGRVEESFRDDHRLPDQHQKIKPEETAFHHGDLLSAYVRHYASVRYIWNLWRKYPLCIPYPPQYKMPSPIPKRFSWCEPYLEELVEFLQSAQKQPDDYRRVAML
jgi:hypothetical protein